MRGDRPRLLVGQHEGDEPTTAVAQDPQLAFDDLAVARAGVMASAEWAGETLEHLLERIGRRRTGRCEKCGARELLSSPDRGRAADATA